MCNVVCAGAGIGTSGGSHGGLGGRGGCGGYTTCRLPREAAYGDLYRPVDHGSGGAQTNGGTGKWQLKTSINTHNNTRSSINFS